jgi:hypothetical protein
MKRLFFALLVIIYLGAVNGHAQVASHSFKAHVTKVGTTAAPFLTIGVGARANAMGGAFVSVANDVTALYWNPAGISLLSSPQLALIHSEWIADLRHDYIGLALPLGSFGALGASVNSLTMDDLEVRTTAFPEGTGDLINCFDLAIGLTYGIQLTDRISIGASGKYVSSKLYHMNASALGLDLGVMFSNIFDFLQFGAAMTNMGTKMKFDGRDTYVYYDLRPSEAGNNAKIDAKLCTQSFNLPVAFQVGFSTVLKKYSKMPLLLAVDFYEPSDNVRSINLGAEWAFYNKLFLRGGYARLFEDDSERGLTVGAGCKITIPASSIKLHLDYSYEEFGLLDNSQKVSLHIAL